MTIRGEGKFSVDSRSSSGRLYLPAKLVSDSQFPLSQGINNIRICVADDSVILCITKEKKCMGCGRGKLV